MKEVNTTLICSYCFKESRVKITYLGDDAVKITCERCGHITQLSPESLSTILCKDWEQRILTKPIRIVREMKDNPVHFFCTLPLRILTKPFRVAKELEKNLIS